MSIKQLITIIILSVMYLSTFGQLIITGGLPDSFEEQTDKFSLDTIKKIGDSTFCIVRKYEYGKLTHQEEQIFIAQRDGSIETIFHGSSIQWDLNGKKICQGQFYYGVKIGQWKYRNKKASKMKKIKSKS